MYTHQTWVKAYLQLLLFFGLFVCFYLFEIRGSNCVVYNSFILWIFKFACATLIV